MEYQTIKGVKVPSVGLGTWRLTGEECIRTVERALALGYRHIDTAQIYANEDEVERAIRNSGVDREEIFLVTKVWTSSFSHDGVIRSTRGSLEKLRAEYVDLLFMHWPNPRVPLEETLGAMRVLREEGSVKHVGGEQFPSLYGRGGYAARRDILQPGRVPPLQGREELLEQAKEMDNLLTAYSPVAGGAAVHDETLHEIGESHAKTAAPVALHWLIQQDKVAAIPKAASEDYLGRNIDIFDFDPSDEEMERVSALRR